MADGLDISETSLGSGSPSLSKVAGMAMGQYEKDKKEYDANFDARKETRKNLASDVEDMRTHLKDRQMPEPPPEVQLPKPPEQKQTSAMEAFGSMGSLVGLLFGAFTKTPFVTSIEASTAAMNAIHQNDSDTYKAAMDKWKTQSDYMLKVADYQQKRYHDILDNEKTSVDEKINLMRMETSLLQDENGQRAALTNDLGVIERAVHDRDLMAKQAQDAVDKMSVGDQEYKKWLQSPEAQAANPQQKIQKHSEFMMMDRQAAADVEYKESQTEKMKADAAKSRKTAEGGGTLDDRTVTFMAEQVLAGDKSPYQNLGRGAQGADNIKLLREKVMEIAQERGISGPQLAAINAEFAGITSGERVLGNRTAQIGMAVSEARKLAPLALEASEKVNRTKYPKLNEAILAGERGTGDENVVRFGIAVNSLINIYARAISPTGVPTVSDKEHARELLSTAWSKGQIRAGIDQLMKEMNAASQAPGMVRQEFRDAVTKEQPPVSGSIGTVPQSGPAPNTVQDGYRFKGGDPSKPESWEKVN